MWILFVFNAVLENVVAIRSGRITAGLSESVHARGVWELTNVGPGLFFGRGYVEILVEAFLPTVKATVFPETAVQGWFREHYDITL